MDCMNQIGLLIFFIFFSLLQPEVAYKYIIERYLLHIIVLKSGLARTTILAESGAKILYYQFHVIRQKLPSLNLFSFITFVLLFLDYFRRFC